jgi:hypothetical protein
VTPLGYHALKLAARGLRVFPVVCRGKKPQIPDNLKLAAVDEAVIAAWWRSIDWNIGVAVGACSGVWVLDIDGAEGEQTLSRLEAEHDPLPATVESITGGGRHLYFRWPDGVEIRNSQVRADLPGIDIRGDGGYVIVPPSVHPNGRRYVWSVDSANEFADAPQWLLDIAAKRRRVHADETEDDQPQATPPEVWRVLLDQEHEGSHRGGAIARLAGLLLRRYVDPYAVLGLCFIFNEQRCNEPLARTEIRRIVNEICHREADRREARSSRQGA